MNEQEMRKLIAEVMAEILEEYTEKIAEKVLAQAHMVGRPLTTLELAARWSCCKDVILGHVSTGFLIPLKFSDRMYRFSMEQILKAEKLIEVDQSMPPPLTVEQARRMPR